MSSIDRKPHVLNKEKTVTIPRHFIFFDTETTPKQADNGDTIQEFKLGWAVYYRRSYGRHKEVVEWFFFDSISDFWYWLFSKTMQKEKLWVIARNIAFDFTVTKGWKYLHDENYKLKFFHNNGQSCIITVQKPKLSIVFLDSLNWFSESLAKTGERINIPKIHIDFTSCSYEELKLYCRNDVLIEFENFKLFIQFLESNTISRLCYTKASTAMAAYLLRHYNNPIYIHNNKEAIKLERDSYKGGRCECFYIGDLGTDKYYTLDVNSLYPFCMLSNKYPTKYVQLLHHLSIKDCKEALEKYSIVAKVQLETDEPAYAIKTQRTIFPLGNFEATLCTPELKFAIDHNHIKKIYDCVLYEQADIFSSYVNSMYALRNEFKTKGIKEYEVLCKYLLNSLYGKFGQKAENWVKIGDAPNEPDREELVFYTEPKRVMRFRYLLGQLFELKGYSEAYNSFPAISAHVTAFGRMYLYNLMNICKAGNYFYCDTDSLIVNETGFNNLLPMIDSVQLGKLKLEETFSNLIIWGLKDYKTDKKTALKGIRKNAVKISDNVYQQEQWPSFRGTLKSGNCNEYKIKHIEKHLTHKYTKGNVSDTGIVTPFVVQQTLNIS